MSEIDELRKELRDSQKQQNEINAKLLEMLTNLTSQKAEQPVNTVQKQDVAVVRKSYDNLRQPRPDAMIRLQSLTKGELCLNVNGSVAINFDKYGDIKPVLYSELMNIVNNNRRFAEEGAFYIMDDASVKYLGLSRYYDNILSYDEIESLESYSDDELRTIVPKISDFQKDVVSLVFANRIYNDEQVDRNKIEVISKACEIDIAKRAREMKQIADNMKEWGGVIEYNF